MELNTFYNKGRSSWFQNLSGIIILIWNEFFPPTPYKVSDKIRAYLWGSAVEIHLKDSLPIMKLYKTDLFSPLMTEFEHTGHFWSDKYTMTSSVKIFKIWFFRCICSLDINFRLELFLWWFWVHCLQFEVSYANF